MSFRFWRRIKIAPGITLNLSKSGGSLSFGPRGAKLTVGPRGKRVTTGIPGTGLFYTSTFSNKGSNHKKNTPPTNAEGFSVCEENRLTMGFFKKLITPDDEKALINGCRELIHGSENKALEYLKNAIHLADGAYLAGFIAIKKKQFENATLYLTMAAKKHKQLGQYFSKYGISATMSLPITEEVSAYINPDLRGVLLGLVEIYQSQEQWNEVTACLKRLRQLEPDDVVVKLSLAELLLDSKPLTKDVFHGIIKLGENVENESPIHAALLLYKAKAFRGLNLPTAARDTLTTALRRKKNRPAKLLHALRYERALVYEDLGKKSRARAEFEKLYAESPTFNDVAKRLGI